VLVTIIFELVFSQPDANNRFFFSDEKRDNFTIQTVKNIFYCFPSFTLSICFGALIKVAAAHLDQAIFAWIPGRIYGWSDFSQEITGKLADGTAFTMPSPLHSVMVMVGDIAFYLILTWYFDHVISANRGVAE
jgi:hypothetical protein